MHRFDTNVVTRSHLEAAKGTEKLEFPTFRKLLRLGEAMHLLVARGGIDDEFAANLDLQDWFNGS